MKASEHKQCLYFKIQKLIDEHFNRDYEDNMLHARQIVMMDALCDVLERLDSLEEKDIDSWIKGERK